jgi:hypothetical protein
MDESIGRPLQAMVALLYRLARQNDEKNDRRLAELSRGAEHLQRQVDALRILLERSGRESA